MSKTKRRLNVCVPPWSSHLVLMIRIYAKSDNIISFMSYFIGLSHAKKNWYQFIPCHVISYHLISSDSISLHRILSPLHFISSHQISSYHISSNLSNFISCHLISSHLILSYLISFHNTSCHLLSSYLISNHVMSSHVKSCHLKLSPLMSSQIILFHTISYPLIS